MVCNGMLCYLLLCRVKFGGVMLCFGSLYYILCFVCFAMSSDVVLCCILFSDVRFCWFLACYVM